MQELASKYKEEKRAREAKVFNQFPKMPSKTPTVPELPKLSFAQVGVSLAARADFNLT